MQDIAATATVHAETALLSRCGVLVIAAFMASCSRPVNQARRDYIGGIPLLACLTTQTNA
jgi:hypothetical protein